MNATVGGFKLGLKQGGNVGSRFYLLDSANKGKYRMFNLKNREFSFDVDVSTLGCGINGALYFVEMPEDGGEADSRLGLNKAGAKYGTGYCDAQCANDIKFIGGVANIEDPPYGSCCAEMDIWESNSQATAYTAHPCSFKGQLRCEADDCDKVCDMGGCDFNAYRNGVKTHFGPGSKFDVDSSKPVTAVTQFLTTDGTDAGDLKEIRRFYVQDGKQIPNAKTQLDGLDAFDSITEGNCQAQKDVFGEDNTFESHGGMKGMSDAMDRGMVLVMSIWDDNAANMLWLDSVYPEGATGPGAERGPCATDSGAPADVEKEFADSYVSYMNIKFGEIGSTGGQPTPTPTPAPSGGCNDGTVIGEQACGYNCDENCNCGRCNTKPGCGTEEQCLGNCNAGGNAKWCPTGVTPTPTPAPTPTGGCCSWDGKYCGDTTDYCKASADQCADCDGKWCTNCLPPYSTTTPAPTPSDCPGGSLDACIDMCPMDMFAECVKSCQKRCGGDVSV